MNRQKVLELAIEAGLVQPRLAAGDQRINEAESYVLATQLDQLEDFANLVIAAERGDPPKKAEGPTHWGYLG